MTSLLNEYFGRGSFLFGTNNHWKSLMSGTKLAEKERGVKRLRV